MWIYDIDSVSYKNMVQHNIFGLFIVSTIVGLAGCTSIPKQELQALTDKRDNTHTHTPEIGAVRTYPVIQIATC